MRKFSEDYATPYANSVVGVEALLLQSLHEAVAFHAPDRFPIRLFLSKLKEVNTPPRLVLAELRTTIKFVRLETSP